MAFTKLAFERDWNRVEDFPTYQDSEQQVRADFQYHPDAILKFINETLLKELEAKTASANIGDSHKGTVALTLADLYALLDNLRTELEQAVLNGLLPEGVVLSTEDIRSICV
jgi:hypothetical protein